MFEKLNYTIQQAKRDNVYSIVRLSIGWYHAI